MDQVMKLNFVRETHLKKYKKLMKFNLPAELGSLRWVGAQASDGQILHIAGSAFSYMMCIYKALA